MDGTWKSEDTWDGMGPGMVAMAPYTNLPDDVVAMAQETQAKITSGEFHPFTGPIDKQDGSMAIGEGEFSTTASLPHELVREGHRRQAAGISASRPGSGRAFRVRGASRGDACVAPAHQFAKRG